TKTWPNTRRRAVMIGNLPTIGPNGKNMTRRALRGLCAATLAAVGMFGSVVPKNSLDDGAQQIVGRERRERVSQPARCGERCFDSRRRVNSTVRRLVALNQIL